MSFRIQSNPLSLQGQQGLTAAQGAGGAARTAAAARGPAGGTEMTKLAIGGQQTQAWSANAASREVQEGLSVLGTARKGLDNSYVVLNRMEMALSELATGAKTEAARADTQKKLADLMAELDKVATDTNFNGKKLLDGSMAQNGMPVQVGSDTFAVRFASASSQGLGLSGLSVSDDASMQNAFKAVQTAHQSLVGSKMDAAQKEMAITMAAITSAGASGLEDVQGTLATTRSQMLQQAGTAELAQGNAAPQAVLALLR
ncbi:MAG: hypothetical protein HZB16_23255 [Armatimonadetes bacterium]|nr:hypothetical protein [Armatimonadota bacterium]